MPDKPRVLVTGGSGRIGQMFLRHQGHRYALRLSYHNHPFEAPPHEVVAMDLGDYASVLAAMQGMDAVLHLGADSGLFSEWDAVLRHNIIGTYHAYEAAREAGVRRFVYASSNHASGRALAENAPVGPDAPIRPDSLYGVSKCYGEALGRYYHDQHGLEVICLRIGSCHGSDDMADQSARARGVIERGGGYPYDAVGYLGIWASPRDMAHLLARSLDADCDWGIFYGSSDNTPPSFDLSETKRVLGYRPQDNVRDLLRELGQGAEPESEYMTQSVSNMGYHEGASDQIPERKPKMEAEIVTRETIQVLGVQERIEPQSADYGAIWGKKYDPRQDEIAAFANEPGYYGIYYDYGQPPMCEFLAGQGVGPVEAVPEGLVLREVPGGQYAKFVCTMADIGATWGRIMAEWMPTAAFVVDESRPSIEWYAPTDDVDTGETHIYMAVVAK